jgi:XTP/dITP diphosphohydrolase
VEDSGIFIKALSGFPGPYSSFVYETIGLRGILDMLRRHSDRRAYFQCTVAFGSSGLDAHLFTGKVAGKISRRVVGIKGFGYDPIFIPDGSTKTFGQTSSTFKNSHSHRAKAFQKFAKWYSSGSTYALKSGWVREP